jgi:hypothetical protein
MFCINDFTQAVAFVRNRMCLMNKGQVYVSGQLLVTRFLPDYLIDTFIRPYTRMPKNEILSKTYKPWIKAAYTRVAKLLQPCVEVPLLPSNTTIDGLIASMPPCMKSLRARFMHDKRAGGDGNRLIVHKYAATLRLSMEVTRAVFYSKVPQDRFHRDIEGSLKWALKNPERMWCKSCYGMKGTVRCPIKGYCSATEKTPADVTIQRARNVKP